MFGLWLALGHAFMAPQGARAGEVRDILEARLTIKVESLTVKDFLKELETISEAMFVYSESKIDLSGHISRDYRNETLRNILTTTLPKGVAYNVSGMNIILKPRIPHMEATGTIIGTVTDGATGEALAFASVFVRGSSKGVITDVDGNYMLREVSQGEIDLEVSFMGYEKLERSIVLADGGTMRADFALTPMFGELQGVTVTGMRKGETKALSQMKTAENIKYVLSQEQMERFPDVTLSESLQRVPGVAVGYSYGLPQDIIIRGLGQGLSSITLNGNRVPSTSAGGRDTDLNGVLSNTVESIEVIKTLTPDLDADGTGGIVNIVTKAPPIGSETLEVQGSAGYNNLVDKTNFGGGVTYGRRKNKLGFIIGGKYQKTWRGEDRISKGYDEFDINGTESTRLEEYVLNGHLLERDRLGVNAEVNFYPNERSKYYLRGSFNKYYELQQRYEHIVGIGNYTTPTSIDDISVQQSGNWRDYHRDFLTFSLGGETLISSLDVDFDLTYNGGKYDQPIYYHSTFVRNGLAGTLDVSRPKTPMIDYGVADPFDPGQYTSNSYINRHDISVDHDGQFAFNASKLYDLGSFKGEFKFGGKARYKYNDRSRNYFRYTLEEGNFVLSDFLADYGRDDYYDDTYSIGNFPNAQAMHNFYKVNQGLFVDDIQYTRQNTDPDSFHGNEYLGAFYVMTKLNRGPLKIVGGVRYEQTGFHYKGNQLIIDETGVYIGTNPVDTDKSFDGFFPSLNLKYALGENTNIRYAITRSLARPNYYDLVPWEEVLTNREEVAMGNPELVQATSINNDILFEHYFQSVGLISAGVFHKTIKDYIYETNYIQVGGPYDGWEVEQMVNGADATVKGFELSWQQQFTFLPGFLNGLGIYANYTYVDSKIEVPGLEADRENMLPGMRPHVGNVSLSYEKYGFSGRVSMYFFDTYVTELGGSPDDDEFEEGRAQIDISASQSINDRLSLFANVSNLTNRPISYRKGSGLPIDDNYYSTWGSIGLRYKL